MPSCFNRFCLLFLHVHDDIYIIHYLIHSENKKKQKRDDVTLMRKNNHASKAKQNNVNVIYQIAFLEN